MALNIDLLKQVEQPYAPPTNRQRDEASLALLIDAVLALPDVQDKHRRQLVDTAVWKYTEAAGMAPHPKYNLQYVTDGARDLSVPADIQHEHVWERSWIITQLMAGAPWTGPGLTDFLAKHAVACTVTKEEHADLGQVNGTGWQRYVLAGISVWDRQEQTVLSAGEAPKAAERAPSPSPSPAHRFELSQLINDRASASAAAGLHRLVRSARFMSAVSVPAVKKNGDPSDYFRIHDTMLDQPSAAVAYPHWSGKVDFALRYEQVPEALRGPTVGALRNAKYGVTCGVSDEASLETAEELLFLSLEVMRETSAGI